MEYKFKKQLIKLNNERILKDVKQFIKSNHEFYTDKVPELKVLAVRLHEEYTLNKFYKVFNKFWKSLYPEEICLGVYTLQLYKNDFNFDTWKFIKGKLKDIKDYDLADNVGVNIIGEILLRDKKMEKEIIRLTKSKNHFERRIAIVACLPLIREHSFEFPLKVLEINLDDDEVIIEKANSWIIREIGKVKK